MFDLIKIKDLNYLALLTEEGGITYDKFISMVFSCCKSLKEVGIKKGDKVVIYSENCPEYVITICALLQIGAICIPINIRWTESEITEALRTVKCKFIISSRNMPAIKTRYKKIFFDQLLGKENPSYNTKELSLKREATIIFTSGSSGSPKPVLHTLENHYYSALGSNSNIHFGAGNRWAIFLPLYHVGGISIIFRAIISGGAIVISKRRLPIADAINTLRITHISLVPTQLYRMLKDKDSIKSLQKLDAILLGGAPARESLIKKAKQLGLKIYTTYGSTEMASQVTTTRPNDTLKHLLTSGRLLPYRELMIDKDGEIMVKGKTLFKGYLYGDTLIRPFTEDGWFRTSDIGTLDKEGYLTVYGRKDNMFISGGENIQPEEIEEKLTKIDGIIDAVVVPVEDEEWGSRPVAFVYLDKKEQLDEAYIKKELEKELSKYKIPDRIFVISEELFKKEMKLSREHFKRMAKRIMERD